MKKIISSLLITLAAGLGAQDFTIGVHSGNAAPYIIGPLGNPTGGIVFDLAQAVARELGAKVSFKELSRNRVESEMFSGNITVIPVYNPNWTQAGDKIQWSTPIFVEKNIFVVPKAKAAGYTSMESFKGQTVGAILGYFYADPFTKALEAKSVVREDVNSAELNYNKLLAGRIGAHIHSDIQANYDFKSKPAYGSLTIAPYVLSEQNIHWGFSAANKVQADKIDAALIKLRDNGTVARILAKYK